MLIEYTTVFYIQILNPLLQNLLTTGDITIIDRREFLIISSFFIQKLLNSSPQSDWKKFHTYSFSGTGCFIFAHFASKSNGFP